MPQPNISLSSSSNNNNNHSIASLSETLNQLLTVGGHPSSSLNNDNNDHAEEEDYPISFEAERLLVAWVILLLLLFVLNEKNNDDGDNNSDNENLLQQRVWAQHGERLQRFAIDVLLRVDDNDDIDKKNDTMHHQHSLENDNDVRMVQRYLRLVSQVSSAATRSGSSWWMTTTTTTDPYYYPSALGEAILKLWKRLPSSASPLSVHMDVCASLEVFLLADPERANAASVLSVIWEKYTTIMVDEKGQGNDKNNNDGVMEKKEEEDPEWKIMGETLDGILNKQAFSSYSWNAWNDLIFGIFTQEGMENYIPDAMAPLLLEWITEPQCLALDETLRAAWIGWFLTVITTRRSVSDDGSSSKSSKSSVSAPRPPNLFYQALLQEPASASRLQRLLLSNVISPESSNSVSRAMAWQALVSLVDENGFEWMLLQNADMSLISIQSSSLQPTLGQATLLCTWIRLASGEMRIQLQQFVVVDPPDDEDQEGPQKNIPISDHSVVEGRQATGLPIGVACSRLLQSVVQYLIGLANAPTPPSSPPPQQQHISIHSLSGDALLHLRQSLEQALWTAVEYLSWTSTTRRNSTFARTTATNSLQDEYQALLFHSILRLFGTLLMEVDIFDLLEKNHPLFGNEQDGDDYLNDNVNDSSPSSSSSPLVILTCLKGILPVAEDPSLLPGLVHILGDAEGDREKEELIFAHMYDPLMEYLEWYWQWGCTTTTTTTTTTSNGNTTVCNPLDDDTIPWACSLTERWVHLSSMDTGDSSAQSLRRRLCLSLLTWIQQYTLEKTSLGGSSSNTNATYRTYLSLALGCYMTLSKDRVGPPKEHENRLILRALQLCEMESTNTT